jgi:hypothetical protein
VLPATAYVETLVADPSLTKLLIDNDEPMFACNSADILLLIFTSPSTESPLPMRKNDLIEQADPVSICSKKLIVLPNSIFCRREMLLPNLTVWQIDAHLPILVLPVTETVEPSLAVERILSVDP